MARRQNRNIWIVAILLLLLLFWKQIKSLFGGSSSAFDQWNMGNSPVLQNPSGSYSDLGAGLSSLLTGIVNIFKKQPSSINATSNSVSQVWYPDDDLA